MTSGESGPAPQRVVVGACGMGNGHSSRQLFLVGRLVERGHRVALITFNDGVRALHGAFERPVPIAVPAHFPGSWVAMDGQGIDIAASARNGAKLDVAGDAWDFRLCQQVIEELDGEPDVVFTDYEPASAQIAYMLGSRLITTEQQSKFLMYRTPDAGGYTRWHEAAKLRYFFPAAEERIASSFFPMEWERDPRYPGEVLEPILRPDVRQLSPEWDENLVVVYLSPYGPMRQTPGELLDVLSAFVDVRFRVFSREPVAGTPSNVEVAGFDRAAFTESLRTCSGVLSTAGHQLLSECVYLGKPVLAIPFDVYEQQFNAAMLERFGVGQRTAILTGEVLAGFLARRDELSAGARALAAQRFTGQWDGLVERLGL
jgi:uncharacterized protein (TIGR00661 family)